MKPQKIKARKRKVNFLHHSSQKGMQPFKSWRPHSFARKATVAYVMPVGNWFAGHWQGSVFLKHLGQISEWHLSLGNLSEEWLSQLLSLKCQEAQGLNHDGKTKVRCHGSSFCLSSARS